MSSSSVRLNESHCYTLWDNKKDTGHGKYRKNIVRKTRVEHASFTLFYASPRTRLTKIVEKAMLDLNNENN